MYILVHGIRYHPKNLPKDCDKNVYSQPSFEINHELPMRIEEEYFANSDYLHKLIGFRSVYDAISNSNKASHSIEMDRMNPHPHEAKFRNLRAASLLVFFAGAVCVRFNFTASPRGFPLPDFFLCDNRAHVSLP